MEQCKEKFAFVEICTTLTSNSAPMVQHRVLFGKKDIHDKEENPGLAHFSSWKRLEALDKSVWPSLLWGAAPRHPTKTRQEN